MKHDPPPVLEYHTPAPEPRNRARAQRDAAVAGAIFCWVPAVFGVLQSFKDRADGSRRASSADVGVLVVVSVAVALFVAIALVRAWDTVGAGRLGFVALSLGVLIVVVCGRLVGTL